MIILAILALLCLAFAGTLAVRAVAITRTRTLRNLDTIALHGYAPTVADGDDRQRAAIDRLAGALGGAASRRLSIFREEELNRRLIAAGLYNVGARRLFGYQLLLVVAVPLLLIWLMALAGASAGLVFLFAIAGAIFGWIGPLYYVGRR